MKHFIRVAEGPIGAPPTAETLPQALALRTRALLGARRAVGPPIGAARLAEEPVDGLCVGQHAAVQAFVRTPLHLVEGYDHRARLRDRGWPRRRELGREGGDWRQG